MEIATHPDVRVEVRFSIRSVGAQLASERFQIGVSLQMRFQLLTLTKCRRAFGALNPVDGDSLVNSISR